MLSTKAFSLEIQITRILIHRASGCAWHHSHSVSTVYSETQIAPGLRTCTSWHPSHLEIFRKGQPRGPKFRDSKQPESAKRGRYLQTLMTSRHKGTRIAWWPVHKKSRVRQIGRVEHAFRPAGLKGSRERPARLTVILNYLENGLLSPLLSRGQGCGL